MVLGKVMEAGALLFPASSTATSASSPFLSPPSAPPSWSPPSPVPSSTPSAPSPSVLAPSTNHLGDTVWEDLDPIKFLGFVCVATVIENGVMYPFWALKTRQQVQVGHMPRFSLRAIYEPFQRLGGVRRLYRGFPVYAISSLPAYVVYVTTYTYGKSALGFHLHDEEGEDQAHRWASTMAPLFAGVVADAACLGLYVPVDVTVQRLQLPGRYRRGVRQVLGEIWQTEGALGFYRGFGATVVTSAVASGVWWLGYENIKKELAKRMEGLGTQMPSWAHHTLPHLTAGFLAGGAAALITNPLDIVKTRLQTDPTHPPGARAFCQALARMLRQEGLAKSFLRGIGPRLITTAPLGMLSSFIYERVLVLSRKDGYT